MSANRLTRREFALHSGLAAAAAVAFTTPATAEAGEFRLGIVGSDNSHAEAFASLANLESGKDGLRVPGLRVTHICGDDPAITGQKAKDCQIANIVEKHTDMIGQVDGILNVRRHGGRHLEDALPFLEAGVPVFIDKPLACSVQDAETLINAAQKSGVGFTSFSTLPFESTYQAFLAEVKEKAGAIAAGSVSGPCELNSEYGGIYFYGIHSVDLLLETFGLACESVSAAEKNGHVHATCLFKNGPLVSLQLMHDTAGGWHVNVFGEKAHLQHKAVVKTHYFDGLTIIKETLTTGKWPRTPEALLRPIQVLDALDRSLKSGGAAQV
ncbi:MAG: Gfo/Idh/MocA family oxidoreductase [Candidatus Hydrogenedentes bacterium]|nr:Gfo/Idh/MocA family oxidoreductase [Candidatus Hydrogenedentota bacterium]